LVGASWWKWLGATLGSLAAVVAAGATVRTCYVHNQRNEDARRQFVLDQRPWLEVKPVKYVEEDSFIRYVELSKAVEARTLFKLTNRGKQTARNVVVPVRGGNAYLYDTKTNLTHQVEMITSMPDTSHDIAPSETYWIQIRVFIPTDTPTETIADWGTREYPAELVLVVNYDSPVDSSQHYQTKIHYRLSRRAPQEIESVKE